MLSIATVVKVVKALPQLFAAQGVHWSELLLFAVAIFLMGFASGVVVWTALPLSKKLGRIGDAIVGAVTMVSFFLMCMLLFDRSLLTTHLSRGLLMLGFAIVFGVAIGVWVGKDLRKPMPPWIP